MKTHKVKFKKLRNRELYSAKVGETTIRAKKDQLENIGELEGNIYMVDLIVLLKQVSWNEFTADLFESNWGERGTVKDKVEKDLKKKQRLEDFYSFVNQFDEWEEPTI